MSTNTGSPVPSLQQARQQGRPRRRDRAGQRAVAAVVGARPARPQASPDRQLAHRLVK